MSEGPSRGGSLVDDGEVDASSFLSVVVDTPKSMKTR
jgi:hypothetical protein